MHACGHLGGQDSLVARRKEWSILRDLGLLFQQRAIQHRSSIYTGALRTGLRGFETYSPREEEEQNEALTTRVTN